MTKRANGTGNIYKRGNTWTARVVDHWEPSPTSKSGLKPVWKTKGGFAKKKDAQNYCVQLYQEKRHEHPPKEFKKNFELWKASYESRIKASTMAGYMSAFKHFERLYYVKIDQISNHDLQDCIDQCSCGKRTKQMMSVVAGLVFAYAIADDQIMKDSSENLYTGDDATKHYDPLTEEELKTIADSKLPSSNYIVALCYLGHRPSEFFGFKKSDYTVETDGKKKVHYISGGIKTDAGKNRLVTVPPVILPIIEEQLKLEGTDLLFPRLDYDRKGNFKGYSQMPTEYFNKHIFKPLTAQLGIIGKVPYSARHTYSNKIKRVAGADKDKAELMGHADYTTTKKHYQSSTIKDLKAITDKIK